MIADKDPAGLMVEAIRNVAAETCDREATVDEDGAVMIENHESVDVFLGVDVGKSAHHAVALGRDGSVLLDRPLPNDEGELREIIRGLRQVGTVLLVVDQPATIGALPVAVAQAEEILVGYLPGLAMRQIADLHAGHAKTDPRDAFIIAQAARTLPHALRSITIEAESVAELGMLCGFDEDIVKQINATTNRLGGLLTQIHPALERVIGPRLDHPAVLELLQRYPSPEALAAAGRARIENLLVKRAPRIGRDLAERIMTALAQQTVIVAGPSAARLVIPRLAEQLQTLRRQRAEIAAEVERLVEAHPLHRVLTSMPGVGVGTCARLLTEVSGRHFDTAAHLAAYAGLAPITRRSGTSIRGERPSARGNRALKRALFLSAFAALRDPVSRAYYDRKIAQGKRHNQALIALTRRRIDVLYAMLRDGTLYDANHALAA